EAIAIHHQQDIAEAAPLDSLVRSHDLIKPEFPLGNPVQQSALLQRIVDCRKRMLALLCVKLIDQKKLQENGVDQAESGWKSRFRTCPVHDYGALWPQDRRNELGVCGQVHFYQNVHTVLPCDF